MTILVAVRKDGKVAVAADQAVTMGDYQQTLDNVREHKFIQSVNGGFVGVTGSALFLDEWRLFEEEREEHIDLSTRKAARQTVRHFRMWAGERDERLRSLDQEDWPTFLAVHPELKGLLRMNWDGGVDLFHRYLTVGARAPCWVATGVIEFLMDTECSAEAIAKKAVRIACKVCPDIVAIQGMPDSVAFEEAE